MVFRLAIEHQIPIVPISFADNKKRLSYTFSAVAPANACHTNKLKLLEKTGLTEDISGRSSGCHLYSASRFENQSKRKTDVYKNRKELAMANSFSLCVC
jgi:1-acyl-sn-glycerol-3-phosphate acyltransferase